MRRRIRLSHNPCGSGWDLRVTPFGRGGGYRAYDMPWHGMSIRDPWWRTRPWVSYIPGYTLQIIWRAKVYTKTPYGSFGPPRFRRLWVRLSSNGNTRGFPAWW